MQASSLVAGVSCDTHVRIMCVSPKWQCCCACSQYDILLGFIMWKYQGSLSASLSHQCLPLIALTIIGEGVVGGVGVTFVELLRLGCHGVLRSSHVVAGCSVFQCWVVEFVAAMMPATISSS